MDSGLARPATRAEALCPVCLCRDAVPQAVFGTVAQALVPAAPGLFPALGLREMQANPRLIRFENTNIAQVAIFLGEVKSIPYDEFVRNTEADIRNVDLP